MHGVSLLGSTGLAGRCMPARGGGRYCATRNAANEEAVAAFLAGRLRFTAIPVIIETVSERAASGDGAARPDLTPDAVLSAEIEAGTPA